MKILFNNNNKINSLTTTTANGNSNSSSGNSNNKATGNRGVHQQSQSINKNDATFKMTYPIIIGSPVSQEKTEIKDFFAMHKLNQEEI